MTYKPLSGIEYHLAEPTLENYYKIKKIMLRNSALPLEAKIQICRELKLSEEEIKKIPDLSQYLQIQGIKLLAGLSNEIKEQIPKISIDINPEFKLLSTLEFYDEVYKNIFQEKQEPYQREKLNFKEINRALQDFFS